jgi:ABC-type nitrate/sulfonate/bicarbonate transport system ATPase subunit
MIRFEHVTFGYTPGASIFADFSWGASRGETWSVTGASGCGKSTLLMLLAGLRQPAVGQVTIDGVRLIRPRPQTGLIIQDYGLLPWATIRQNVALGQEIRSLYGPDGKHAPSQPVQAGDIEAWLERLGLSAVAGHYPHQVSGGQRQRTAIARTLLLRPDLLLMDEPFSSLDAPTREGLQALAIDLWAEEHLTLVLVTHSIEEAALVGQKILVLGAPPNREPILLDNPGAAAGPAYRETAGYTAVCRELRSLLEPR